MRIHRRFGALLVTVTAGAACRPATSSLRPLVSVGEARQLRAGEEVRLHGWLGLYDAASRSGYLQDAGAGVYIEAAGAPSVPAAGREIEAEGVIERRGGAPLLRVRAFRIVSPGHPTPEPVAVTASDIGGDHVAGTWVATEGVVTQITEHDDWHAIRIDGDGATFVACVAQAGQDRPAGQGSILGFQVRAQGVRVTAADRQATARGCALRLPARVNLRFLRDTPRTASLPLPPLTTIDTIRALSPTDTRKREPVRVRGVVTAHDRDENLLFVQDKTAGVYVEAWRHLHDVTPGELVEVTGRVGPGAFAPIVEWPQLAILGRAPFPPAIRLQTAVAPALDSQWIEVEGIVRSAELRTRRAVLELVAFGERLRVHLPGIVDLERVRPLVDAQVRVQGVYRANFSTRRQLVGVEIHVPRLDLVSVLAPAPRDPYAAPLRRSDTVLEFQPRDTTGRRLHVRGVVTLHRPGRVLYLRDAGGPLRVETRDEMALAPGDEVDVVGFPGVGDYRPVLQDASYRRGPRLETPAPVAVAADQAMSGDLDGELVRIEGRLVERFTPEGETRLLLQSPLHLFEAALPEVSAFESLRRGSRVSVTGIATVKADAARVPQSFQILMRDPADLRLVENAPWWTPQRTVLAVAGLVALAAGAFVWVGTLHRRVREQTEVLRRRLGREAALEERTRLARELHDTLEQNLAGIGYALEAVKHTLEHPSVARAHLDRALTHVDQSMADARRSVSALRPRALEEGDLVSALSRLAGEVTRGGVARADVDVGGPAWPLLPDVEDHLFRIGQEAITNALKHAGAARLRIELRFAEAALELGVRDDGGGFDTTAAVRDGHYGLVGMRERAAKIGATLDVRSTLGQGTTIFVAVPRVAAALPQVS